MAMIDLPITSSPQTDIVDSLLSSTLLDSFGRLRTSSPTTGFDAQYTNDLQPLLFDKVTLNSGATVTHDTTNRVALMTFASTPTGGKAYVQSFEFIPYQPGRSQKVYVTFNFREKVANCLKFAGYSDGINGIEFRANGTQLQFVILSNTSLGTQTANQSAWNIDPFDGTGASGLTLDITKIQILEIDFQALYSGRIRIGFCINGISYLAHEFYHANIVASTFIQYASLPIRIGMTCTGTVSTTMTHHCSSVISESGSKTEDLLGFEFSTPDTAVTAVSATRTHLISVRPKTTFNSLTNRTKIITTMLDMLVTGNSPIYWELCIGQAITGASWADVNTTYSSLEYSSGTLSGNPTAVIDSGYVASSTQSKGLVANSISARYPITLDSAGANRTNGVITLVVKGIGADSACRGMLTFKEVR